MTATPYETMADAARRYGVTYPAVRKWKAEGAPFFQQGRNWLIDPDTLDRWCQDNGRGTGAKRRRFGAVVNTKKFTGSDNDLDREIREAELRRRQADAEKKELANAKLAGELIARTDVEALERGRLVAMKAGLNALAIKLAARLAHLGEQTEIEGVVQSEVNVLLEAYADGREYPTPAQPEEAPA